jgi:hypothetical protein
MKYKEEYKRVENENQNAKIILLQAREKFRQGCSVVELMVEVDRAIEELK